ncbi:MAG: hypothetical protein WKF36_06475 [Candidatus Nitrosocosmicus sp.]
MTVAIMVGSVFAIVENGVPSAFACQTNANGCIENGGPGASFASPPEVSGCRFFYSPAAQCAQTSPNMGQGPK